MQCVGATLRRQLSLQRREMRVARAARFSHLHCHQRKATCLRLAKITGEIAPHPCAGARAFGEQQTIHSPELPGVTISQRRDSLSCL